MDITGDTPEELAKQVFAQRASFYTTSAAHKDPQVLAKVVALANPIPVWHALDVATGTGHTAFAIAPFVTSVIGTDLTPEMLVEARKLQTELGIANVDFRTADAHQLPFEDGVFDLVTSRRAPHHFSDINLALREMRRVLKPGGRLVIDDRSVPEDDDVDTCMNQLDWYHDQSHVREYRPSEWRRMLEESGFQIEVIEPYVQHRPLSSLTHNVDAENVARIHTRLDSLNSEQRQRFNLIHIDGVLHINHWYILLAAIAQAD
ncbi:MAG: methyltransferase domain-containing protein [Chloroflexi bacterium]|nr:methyltransferase domain-containing protein [Chloroflexota bacterium]MCL5275254.1 methyltransferase domain-containing protein [Chloroflexota bacterium]